MATVTNGTSTVPVEIVAARLRRPLRRESIGLLNVAAPQIQAGTPALLAGQLTYLCNSLSDVLALDALYGGLSPITLAGSLVEAGLDGFKHAAIGATEMVAERALPGRPSKWLYSVDVVEVP